jgi:hypothetical protein
MRQMVNTEVQHCHADREGDGTGQQEAARFATNLMSALRARGGLYRDCAPAAFADQKHVFDQNSLNEN